MMTNMARKTLRSQSRQAPILPGLRATPKSIEEFSALAHAMAQTGSFKNAQEIHAVLRVWPEETQQWWSEQLAIKLDMHCRGPGTKRNEDRVTRPAVGPSLSDAPLIVTWPL